MRKVLVLALMSMFFAAMACNKQQNASSPEASASACQWPCNQHQRHEAANNQNGDHVR